MGFKYIVIFDFFMLKNNQNILFYNKYLLLEVISLV